MENFWSQFGGLVILAIIIIISYFINKGKTSEDENSDKKNINKVINKKPDIDIPETCPHCKSPNSKKNRLCEWCGNQII